MNNYSYNNYGNYGNPYFQQPNNYYGSTQFQQPVQQQPTQNNYVIPMMYVNGLVGAKAHYMGTNQIVYLRDSEDDSILYEKKSDNVGKYYLRAFKLQEMTLDNNGGFKSSNSDDLAKEVKSLHEKIDALYTMLVPKQEVKENE